MKQKEILPSIKGTLVLQSPANTWYLVLEASQQWICNTQ